MNNDDYLRTLQNVFGDGDMHPDVVGDDVEPCIVQSEYRDRLRLRVSAPAVHVEQQRPAPRLDPRFVRLMTAEPPLALQAAPQAILDAKTWLHAATHSPSEERCQALVARAVPIVAGLLGEPSEKQNA